MREHLILLQLKSRAFLALVVMEADTEPQRVLSGDLVIQWGLLWVLRCFCLNGVALVTQVVSSVSSRAAVSVRSTVVLGYQGRKC